MIEESVHTFDFDGLDFTGRTTYGSGYRFVAKSVGATFGNAEREDRVLESDLADGKLVETIRVGNREPSFQVWIVGATSLILAEGEGDLKRREKRPTVLGWVPPDGLAPRTEFDIRTWSLDHEFDDMDELNLVRSFVVRAVAAPYAYSAGKVVRTAANVPPTTPTTVVIADGTSATGWTSPGGAVTVSSGALRAPIHESTYYDGQFSLVKARMTRTLSPAVNFTTTRYVTADFFNARTASDNGADGYFAYADGVLLRAIYFQDLNGGRRVTFLCDDASATTLTFETQSYCKRDASGAPVITALVLDNVQRSNVSPVPSNSTGRQARQLIEVAGSARTPGTISIQHPTAGLGRVLFYASPLLSPTYSPDIRPWMSQGTASADSSTISGSKGTSPGGNPTFSVPARLLPAGTYLIVPIYTAPVTATLTVSVTIGGVTVPGSTQTRTPASAGGPLAPIQLPYVDLPDNTAATVVFTLSQPVNFDTLYAFRIDDDSCLIEVNCGTGTPAIGTSHNRLFVSSPTFASDGAPSLRVGTAADGSDSFHPGYPTVVRWSNAIFTPPETPIFYAGTGGANPTITLEHVPAWGSNAGLVEGLVSR